MYLEGLEVYKISKSLSEHAWVIYKRMKLEFKFTIGKQFINSIDSIGANIAEGFGRYHYKDSIKFYYNSRGSLWEAKHWISLLHERNFINDKEFQGMTNNLKILGIKLNNFINSLRKISESK